MIFPARYLVLKAHNFTYRTALPRAWWFKVLLEKWMLITLSNWPLVTIPTAIVVIWSTCSTPRSKFCDLKNCCQINLIHFGMGCRIRFGWAQDIRHQNLGLIFIYTLQSSHMYFLPDQEVKWIQTIVGLQRWPGEDVTTGWEKVTSVFRQATGKKSGLKMTCDSEQHFSRSVTTGHLCNTVPRKKS